MLLFPLLTFSISQLSTSEGVLSFIRLFLFIINIFFIFIFKVFLFQTLVWFPFEIVSSTLFDKEFTGPLLGLKKVCFNVGRTDELLNSVLRPFP